MTHVTVPSFAALKKAGEKIALLTAYDYPSARLVDSAGVDAILVGDSCAMVIMGRKDTLFMTMDEMVYHTKLVSRGAEQSLVIADMPFRSYHVSPEEAVRNAGRLVAEGGAQAVKVEGSPDDIGDAIRAIRRAGIPVMGHLGLTPQSIHQFGGFKVQGRDRESAERIKSAAIGLEALGCFGVVLECIPPDVAQEISEALTMPAIGIGAGEGCDGQILVMHDSLGWGRTRFTKTYADVKGVMEQAFTDYVREVKAGVFPGEEHQYSVLGAAQQAGK